MNKQSMIVNCLVCLLCIGGCGISTKQSGYYVEDGKSYYFTNNVFEHHATAIESADRATFTAIDKTAFALDRNHAYWKGQSVVGAEPGSFRWVKADYGIDSQSVFYEASKIVGASPTTFTVIDRGGSAK